MNPLLIIFALLGLFVVAKKIPVMSAAQREWNDYVSKYVSQDGTFKQNNPQFKLSGKLRIPAWFGFGSKGEAIDAMNRGGYWDATQGKWISTYIGQVHDEEIITFGGVTPTDGGGDIGDELGGGSGLGVGASGSPTLYGGVDKNTALQYQQIGGTFDPAIGKWTFPIEVAHGDDTVEMTNGAN